MKRRIFLKNTGTVLGGLSIPLPMLQTKSLATPTGAVGLPALAVGALKFVGRIVVGKIIEKGIDLLLDNDSCNVCRESNYWTADKGLSLTYSVGPNRISEDNHYIKREKKKPEYNYSAFVYGKQNPTGDNSTNQIYEAVSHERKEIEVLIPEDAIYAICTVCNHILEGGGINNEISNGGNAEIEDLKSIILPKSDKYGYDDDSSNSIDFKTNFGRFVFDGIIEKDATNLPSYLKGKVHIYDENDKCISESNHHLGSFFPMPLNRLTGSLEFLEKHM